MVMLSGRGAQEMERKDATLILKKTKKNQGLTDQLVALGLS